MGSRTFAEIDGPHHLAGREVDNSQQATIRARLANSRVTINRHKGPLRIGRRRHFMAGDAILCDGCDLTASHWINDPERLIPLVGDQEQPTPDFGTRFYRIHGGPCAGRVESQQEEDHRHVSAAGFRVHGCYPSP
jgi:hypothetical protein